MPAWAPFAIMLATGALIVLGGWLAIRAAGGSPGVARRLAGPPEVKVGSLLGGAELPDRPVRVAGRIRCREPLEMGGGERLVAFHRDVDVRLGGAWRTIERLRETRSFELWDHDGSITVDPAAAAEPLIVIPKVWRGDPAELEEPHASAVARLAERSGRATAARAVTRTINVSDRLLLLGRPARDDAGRVRLEPPQGGYLITNLALADAMRLLGGSNRRIVVGAVIGIAVGIGLLGLGALGLVVSALVGA
jgi:hypothetical protein